MELWSSKLFGKYFYHPYGLSLRASREWGNLEREPCHGSWSQNGLVLPPSPYYIDLCWWQKFSTSIGSSTLVGPGNLTMMLKCIALWFKIYSLLVSQLTMEVLLFWGTGSLLGDVCARLRSSIRTFAWTPPFHICHWEKHRIRTSRPREKEEGRRRGVMRTETERRTKLHIVFTFHLPTTEIQTSGLKVLGLVLFHFLAPGNLSRQLFFLSIFQSELCKSLSRSRHSSLCKFVSDGAVSAFCLSIRPSPILIGYHMP